VDHVAGSASLVTMKQGPLTGSSVPRGFGSAADQHYGIMTGTHEVSATGPVQMLQQFVLCWQPSTRSRRWRQLPVQTQ
jgi:hypothetical protein